MVGVAFLHLQLAWALHFFGTHPGTQGGWLGKNLSVTSVLLHQQSGHVLHCCRRKLHQCRTSKAAALPLEVVHVPGLHMVSQGMDGLSHGLHQLPGSLPWLPKDKTLWIFEGLAATQCNIQWGLLTIQPYLCHGLARYISGTSTWDFKDVIWQATILKWSHAWMNLTSLYDVLEREQRKTPGLLHWEGQRDLYTDNLFPEIMRLVYG